MIIPMTAHMLIGRTNGVHFSNELMRLLSAHACVTLDFNDVHVMDGTYANAAFASFAQMRGERTLSGGALVCANMNVDVTDNLSMALISRAAERNLRHCAILTRDYWGQMHIVGKYEANVFEAWTRLEMCHALTASQLARMMTLSLNAASNRLKWLFDLGLCLRTEERSTEGRQFVYRWIEGGK